MSKATIAFCCAGGTGHTFRTFISNSAHNIVNDYLVPLEQKGEPWLVAEMSESYPQGTSDPFVYGVTGAKNLVSSRRHARPFREYVEDPSTIGAKWFNDFHRETAVSGQQIVLYTLPYYPPNGSVIFV